MLNKLNSLSTKAYIKGCAAIQNMKNGAKSFLSDERGLSGVVVAVLLILIAVLLIAAMWGSMKVWLSGLWDKIIGAGGADKFENQTWKSE